MMRKQLILLLFLLINTMSVWAQNRPNDPAASGSDRTIFVIAVIFITILAVIFIYFLYYANKGRLNYNLRYDAEKYDMELPTLGDRWRLARRGRDPQKIIEACIKAKKKGIVVTMSSMEFLVTKDRDLDKYIKALRLAKNSQLDIEVKKLAKHEDDGGDIMEYVEIMRHARNADLLINDENLSKMHLFGVNFKAYIKSLAKMKHANLHLTDEDLADIIQHSLDGDVFDEIVKALIKAQKKDLYISNITYNNYNEEERLQQLSISLHEMLQLKATQKDVDLNDYVEALSLVKEQNLPVKKTDLKDFILLGKMVTIYVKAIGMLPMYKDDPAITAKSLKTHLLRGGNPLFVLLAYNIAKKQGLENPFMLLTLIDLNHPDKNVYAVARKSDNPDIEVITSETTESKEDKAYSKRVLTIVTKDGVELMPLVVVKTRLKLANVLAGSGKEILFERILEAVTTEFEAMDNHKEILMNRSEVARRVHSRILLEENFNSNSAYELLEVSIPKIKVGKDIYAELKHHEAELEAHHIKAIAEARLDEALAEAIRKGSVNTNELLKRHIYQKKQDSSDHSNDSHGNDDHSNNHGGGHH